MLNKRAQVEDNLEYVLAIILTVIGVVALTLLIADFTISVDNAKTNLASSTTVKAYETQFLGTDLLNLMKAPANASLTYGEFFATLPEFYTKEVSPEEYAQWFSKINLCSVEVYENLNGILSPVYGDYWSVKVTIDESTLYECYNSPSYFSDSFSTNMTLPSTIPGKDIHVFLEVSS